MTNSVVRTVKPAADRRNTGKVDALELEDVLMGDAPGERGAVKRHRKCDESDGNLFERND